MTLYFTVTNDLSYDQRMIRICTSLANNGYIVVLVGRQLKNSIPIVTRPFMQKRLRCFAVHGMFFYAEFNIRLFFFLLFKKMDGICAIDLDTILPCYFISLIKNIHRLYDAHELFCEMKEIVTRPGIYKIWKAIEKFTVPKFASGYTVNTQIAMEFKKMYRVDYGVIRSIALKTNLPETRAPEKYILYQGAVNEGRCFETLIPAMANVNIPLVICGHGNYFNQATNLVNGLGLQDKITFKGLIAPGALKTFTQNAWIGITLFDSKGLSNYFSLANRFFDYMQAGVPQICVDFPPYREINNQYEIAVMIESASAENITKAINKLATDKLLHDRLRQNCLKAREIYNWQNEEKKLIAFYKQKIV